MNSCVRIPESYESAKCLIEASRSESLSSVSRSEFVRVWCAVNYLEPGLHPDDFDEPGSGWSEDLKPYAVEAWRRAGAGELSDEELYPCDATWAGVYDRMSVHSTEEVARRLELAASCGGS